MVQKIPAKHNRGLRHRKWTQVYVDYILRFLKGETKQTPVVVRKYGGKEKYENRNGKLFIYGREVIIDPQRRNKILNEEEENYGGQRKAADRIARKYFNITRQHVVDFFSGSERRQLKARQQRTQRIESFIHATRPGTLQVDLTFYRGAKIPVFGAVDVFSRYAYYERVPNKRADFVVKAMKNCIAHFNKVLHKDRKITKVSSDAGVEFQAEFKQYLKNNKIFYDKQVRARKMIESLNRTLRRYVERVGWDTLSELDTLIEKFIEDYNNSIHTVTRKAPIDLINIPLTEEKGESKRQKKAGKYRMRKTGYTVAELKAGDKVRIYDPKRKEIKSEQKQKLKGKIKLSEQDYVKQYTSSHRGNEPHWTKEIFEIERVLGGERARRYLIKGKKGTFMRSELQKVSRVTKADPRIKIKAKQKKEKDKLLERRPEKLRYVKHIDRYVYFKGDVPEQRGLCIEVYKEMYLLVVSRSKLYIVDKKILVRPTTDKHMATKEREKYKELINDAESKIDDYLTGTNNTLPSLLQLPKSASLSHKKIKGRKVTVDYNGDIMKAVIIEKYKGEYIVFTPSDGSIGAVEEKEVLDHDAEDFLSPAQYKRLVKQNDKEIQMMRADMDQDA